MKLRQITRCLVALALGLFAASSPLHAQLDFGDDSSRYANDGECDDPRFQGPGADEQLLDSDRGHDATDCRALYRSGDITLRSVADTIDFGDDGSRYAKDGECDDPRFVGPGVDDQLVDSDRAHDATDCRNLLAAGRIALRDGDSGRSSGNATARPPPPAAPAIDFGDDGSRYAKDGECDDPRFQGAGSASQLVEADRGHDATDCRELLATGRVTLRGDGGASSSPSSTPPAADAASREGRLRALVGEPSAEPEPVPAPVTADDLKEAFWAKTRDELRACGEGQNASRAACLDRVAGGLGAGAINQRFPATGWSHLSQAASEGDLALVTALVARGADVNLTTNKSLTPLHLAIVAGSPAVVRFLIEHGADVNAKDSLGLSALYTARAFENEEIIKIMREAGAQ